MAFFFYIADKGLFELRWNGVRPHVIVVTLAGEFQNQLAEVIANSITMDAQWKWRTVGTVFYVNKLSLTLTFYQMEQFSAS